MVNAFYKDVDVPQTSIVVKMMLKRAWTRKDVNINHPSLLHVMKGFSPFIMIVLKKD